MRAILGLMLTVLVSGCATPQPVRDAAGLVESTARQMNGAIDEFVKNRQKVRGDDALRLTEIRARADRLAGLNEEQIQLWEAERDSTVTALFKTVLTASLSAVTPGDSDSNPVREVAPITFDGAPLQAVSKTAGQLSARQSGKEELLALARFADQVNSDMQRDAK
jgi:hypothetical protein